MQIPRGGAFYYTDIASEPALGLPQNSTIADAVLNCSAVYGHNPLYSTVQEVKG